MAKERPWRHGLSLLALLVCSGQAALGQEVQKFTLQVEKEIPVTGQTAASTMNPIKCDRAGNIYVRFYQPRFYLSPIVKFSPDGERKAVFSPESVSDWEGAEIFDFAVGRDGQVYLVAVRLTKEKKFEFAILSFNDDGQHRFTTKLKVPLDSVDRFAVFSTGEFFIAGYKEIESTTSGNTESSGSQSQKKDWKTRNVEAVVATIDRSGNLIKEIELPIGPSGEGASPTGGHLVLSASAISLGSATMGDDGNLYLMFRMEKPTIYAITPDGTVARILKVTPPSEQAVAMEVATATGVGLIVKFSEKAEGSSFYPGDKTVFSIVDRQTGERWYDYQSSMRLGPALGCYTPKALLFLGNVKGQFAILRAVPR